MEDQFKVGQIIVATEKVESVKLYAEQGAIGIIKHIGIRDALVEFEPDRSRVYYGDADEGNAWYIKLEHMEILGEL